MNGFIAKTVTAMVLTGGALVAAGGCCHYDDLVDPCYPERYEHMARVEVMDAFGPQVANGRVLEQTVWNYHFDPGTPVLNPGGRDRLAYIARRRPCPDQTVYLQTAQDLGDLTYVQAVEKPGEKAPEPKVSGVEKFIEARNKLDTDRIKAIQEYLTALTAGRHCEFQVVIHDPGPVGMSAIPMDRSITIRNGFWQGYLLPVPRINAIR